MVTFPVSLYLPLPMEVAGVVKFMDGVIVVFGKMRILLLLLSTTASLPSEVTVIPCAVLEKVFAAALPP